ncbi:uncharacterized protein LOC112573375 [Pomacea canaliculata]|uniref:uncharacterized protein LOC112573375 n=1 Tax=Pomacea canaliculata TaxID=400727 RepID=UPI000D73E378|nr:uncharacterized protein LOC112573375 [Pomacea canaliculata]
MSNTAPSPSKYGHCESSVIAGGRGDTLNGRTEGRKDKETAKQTLCMLHTRTVASTQKAVATEVFRVGPGVDNQASLPGRRPAWRTLYSAAPAREGCLREAN